MLGFLGPRGTHSERPARFFAENGPLAGQAVRAYASHVRVLDALESGEVEQAVLALENSLEGSVLVTLDRLAVAPLQICAEVALPIRHAAFAVEPVEFSRVTEVRSHPQVLAQCRGNLHRLFPGAAHIDMESTAAAIAYVAHAGDPLIVCAGALQTGIDAGLCVLQEDLQDVADNVTRFGLVTTSDHRVDVPVHGASGHKTSVLMMLGDDHPGALYEVLRVFAAHGVNLSRLESRPTRRGLGSYHFYIDLLGRAGDEQVRAALGEIETIAGFTMKMLGSYPCFAME